MFTVDPDGGNSRQITSYDGETEHAIQPTFAPSGDQIVFTHVTGEFGVDDRPQAALIDLDSRETAVLDAPAGATHPRLRP